MLDHTGQKCPYCHKSFQAGDDIVVCPECGAPYHRECYLAAGDCVYADQHAAGFEWKPDPGAAPARAEITCPNCGASTPADSQFCKECGAALNSADSRQTAGNPYSGSSAQAGQNPQSSLPEAERSRWNFQMGFLAAQCDPMDTIDGIPLKDWANFVGRGAPSYLSAFKRLEMSGRKFAFSLSALLFGPLFYFFRKMWKWGLIFFGCQVVISIPAFMGMMVMSDSALVAGLTLDALLPWMELATVFNLVLSVAGCVLALPLYRAHCRRHLQKIREQIPEGAQRIETISRTGGTSVLLVVLFLLAQFTLQVFLAANFFGPNLNNLLYMLYG